MQATIEVQAQAEQEYLPVGGSRLDVPVATLQIVQASDVVKDRWLDRALLEPTLKQNADGLWVLTVRRQGTHGQFEGPYIGSKVLLADAELGLVVVLVSYHGAEPAKYGRLGYLVPKGQFYRYFQQAPNGTWVPVLWRQLGDPLRSLVISTVQAQAQLMMNKSQAAKSGMSARLALLRGGIAVCGYCGDKMYCMAWRASSAPRYFCRRYKLKPYGQQPECPGGSHSIAHDVLDARVWEYIVMALTIPEALTEALAHHERESAYRQEQSQKRLTTLRTMVKQREAERERFLVTLSEQDDSETRKMISDRLKALAADMKQLRVDIELEERAWQEPNEQREEIKRLVAWGAQKEGELLQASLEEKRNILRWLRVQVKVWRADHQPRYEVWLFAGEDGSPVLVGRGNGQSGPNAHAPTLTGGTPITCRSRSSLAGMDD